jgi:hypothetical protein
MAVLKVTVSRPVGWIGQKSVVKSARSHEESVGEVISSCENTTSPPFPPLLFHVTHKQKGKNPRGTCSRMAFLTSRLGYPHPGAMLQHSV